MICQRPSLRPAIGTPYGPTSGQSGRCAFLLHLRHAWSGSQKGWFNLAYYEGGASYGQGSGYIYTSFQKTAKIWWDPWQGGDGAIYSTIDGSGSGYPIAEVNNCSRVIKYVVTVGQRSNSYSLVDMRIHDINVVADLSRHDPTAPDPEEPVEYDGTRIGVAETNHEEADMDASDASQEVLIYWTGLWPLLHYEYHKQLIPSDVPSDHPAKAAAGRTLHVHVAKNLLSVTEYQDITISGDGSFGQTSDSVREEWLALLLAGYLIEIGFAGWALEAAIHVANPLAIALASIALSASVLLFYSLFLVFTVDMIDRGVWTCWDSAVKWWVLGLALFLAVFGVGLGMLFSLVGGATPSMKVETQAVTEGSKPLLSVVMKTKFAIWAILVLSALLIGTAVSLTVMSI